MHQSGGAGTDMKCPKQKAFHVAFVQVALSTSEGKQTVTMSQADSLCSSLQLLSERVAASEDSAGRLQQQLSKVQVRGTNTGREAARGQIFCQKCMNTC
jgi:hypothetical protein